MEPAKNKDIHGFEANESSNKKQGKNFFLCIGIDGYIHCPRLHNAVKDAKELVDVLKHRFQFDSENIIELYNKKATKNNIYNSFRKMVTKVTSADNLLIYFSGHGEYDKVFNLGYWIPVDAETNKVDQYLPNSEIRNILSAIKSHHTFLMVDSCFSGALFAKGANRNITQRKERDPSRWGLTAGRNEVVTDGPEGRNSPFADSILYQLKNTDRPIGVAELCDKVLEVVSANANQTPRGEPLKVDGHQGGQFVFHLKKDEIADWKEALSEGTSVAFSHFIAQYPNGKYIVKAKSNLERAKANELYEKIQSLKDDDLASLTVKLELVEQYDMNFENQPGHDEILNVGQFLEFKKKFLEAKNANSDFSIRKFLKLQVPDVRGADLVIKQAKELLLNRATTPLSKTEKVITNKDEIAVNGVTSSITSKYGKYIPLLLLIFLLTWGIKKWGFTPSEPLISVEISPFQDSKTKLWGYKKGKKILLEPKFKKAGPFDNGQAKVSVDGSSFTIDESGSCIADCPPTKEEARKDYLSKLSKGDTELRKSLPNYSIAQKYYKDAIAAVKNSSIDTKEAEAGLKKCKTELNKIAEAEANRKVLEQRKKQKLSEYNDLIDRANSSYSNQKYQTALNLFQQAKNKISTNQEAISGINQCNKKLQEIANAEAKRRREESSSVSEAEVAAVLNSLFHRWDNSWSVDTYIDESVKISSMGSTTSAFSVRGTFKVTRVLFGKSVVEVNFTGTARSSGSGITFSKLCYQDGSDRDCM